MYQQIASNKRKTILLIGGFIIFLTLLGWVLSLATDNAGYVVAIGIFAVTYAFVGYYASARIALALSGAKPVEKADAPELYRVVENLSIAGGLPMPQVYIIDDSAPNAFATGRDPQHAIVVATSGLLDMMDKNELEGVIAHELSHVGNYDIRLMAVVMVLVTIISVISNFFLRMTFWGGGRRRGNSDNDQLGAIFMVIGIVAAIVAPIIATILQLAVSRRREYLADASGALLTRYPEGLASALEKIERANEPMHHSNTATAHLFFADPLRAAAGSTGSWIAGLFSTHPPIEDRIAKLQGMEIKP
jgi:heat shock protein HtpX